MSAETLSHLFEPFFTTKDQGKGTGLGLATVYGIIKQSGGHVKVYSELEQGTSFKIYLPRNRDTTAPVEPMRPHGESPLGSETILVVEDESSVRELVHNILTEKGYTVLQAGSGPEALRLYEYYSEPIHLLLTDMIMPGGLNGRDLAERLQPLYPDMKVLYMSGYTDNAIIQHEMLEPGTDFLQKPFVPDDLEHKVRELLSVL
jgi:CheY-like chemotaxis protein